MQTKLFNNCARRLPLAVCTLFLLLTFCCVKVSGATYTSVGTTLTDGKSYILVANGTTAVKAETAGSNWIAGVDVSDDIDGSTLTTTATNIVWVAKKYDDGKGNITWSFKNGSSYITNGSGSTYRNMSYSDTESKFKINSSKIYSTGATDKWLQYNSTGFRMYNSSTGDGGTFVFYQLDEGSTKTLVYNANGADGGTVPTDATAYNVEDEATVKGNTGGLTKVGFTWSCWNTAANGGGSDYAAGDKFTIGATGNTLYAKWTNTYAGEEFSLVENLSDLSNGSKIIILNAAKTYAISRTQADNNRTAVAYNASDNAGFALSNSDKTVTLASATTVQVITLRDLATPVANKYQFDVENGYLYAAGNGSGNNYLRTQTTNDANGHWLIGLSEGTFSVVAQGTNGNNTLKRNNSNAFFSCYSTGQENVLIYVKDEGTKYDITWANGGHGTAPTSPTNASKVTLPELSESGWQHTGWIADQAVTNVSTSSSISAGTLITNGTRVQLGAATTFTAQWKQICATPTFSVSAGTYNAAQTVSILCATPSGCTIRYTTDGSTPTSSSGTVYSSAITVSVSQTINAIAYKDGCVDSEVASAAYTLKCATPTFDPAAGTKSGAQSVTISCASEGATIYYTTNNTTPSTESTEYSGAIPVSESETIKAIAVIDGWTNSDVASAAYTINYSVTWKVNGETWTSGVSSSNNNANWNTKITAMPTAPTPSDACGDKFMGWSKKDGGSEPETTSYYDDLFTDVSGSPAITEATTFYAVFADYAE